MNLPEIEALHAAFANIVRSHGEMAKCMNELLEKASAAAVRTTPERLTAHTAWMIEMNEREGACARGFVGWWRGARDDYSYGWTKDPNMAVKFLTRADAERAQYTLDLVGQHKSVTEHVWLEKRP